MSEDIKQEDKEQEIDLVAKLKEIEERANKLEEDNRKLKEFNALIVQEKKDRAAKDKADKDKLTKQIMDTKANTMEEAENIAKQWREKAEALEKERDQDRLKEYQRNLQDKALQLAQTKAAKDPNRAKVLADILIRNMKLDDDGNIVVTDDKGNATISPVDELVNKVAENYKFLVDGLDSSGGGMHSNASKPLKKFSDMTVDEKVSLYKESPQKYNEAKLADND